MVGHDSLALPLFVLALAHVPCGAAWALPGRGLSPHTAIHLASREPTTTPVRQPRSPRLVQLAAETAVQSPGSSPGPRSPYQGFDVRTIISYLWPERGATTAKVRVLGAVVLLFVAKVFVVRVPFIFKRCVDSLGAVGTAPLVPVGWMLVYGLSRAVYTLLQEARYLLFTPVGQNALRRFMRDAFEHVQLLDAAWLGSQSTGELSRVFARGVRGMNALLRLVVFNVIPTALEALLVISLLGHKYGPPFLLVSLLCVCSFIAWSLLIVERRVVLLSALNDEDNRIFSKFFNSLLNNEAVRSFTNERHEVKQYDELLERVEDLSVRDVRTVSLLNAGQALIFASGLGAVMSLCAVRVAAGSLSLGDVVAIHGMLLQLQVPLTSLGFTYQEIRQSLTDMRQLLVLLRRSPQVASPVGAQELRVSQGMLRFENVSFGYGGALSSSAVALDGVSFEVAAGKKTALVGPSGSGKSTVLKLITRAYDASSGRITIDGQDVREVSLPSLRRQVGLVPQDTILFDESMMYNLRYGDLRRSERDALQVASRVGLDATASKMPSGYETRVGERGLTLSGGERQRVAIARALLKDPPVMLYDEPTSALDSITEASITDVLRASEANRTSIVVAHRLRMIEDADKIIVMANGSVVEQGTHESLLLRPNSTYSRMWAQQQHGDENFFASNPLSPLEYRGRDSRPSVEEALALQSLDGGWLW